jgi:hypothetical protein
MSVTGSRVVSVGMGHNRMFNTLHWVNVSVKRFAIKTVTVCFYPMFWVHAVPDSLRLRIK